MFHVRQTRRRPGSGKGTDDPILRYVTESRPAICQVKSGDPTLLRRSFVGERRSFNVRITWAPELSSDEASGDTILFLREIRPRSYSVSRETSGRIEVFHAKQVGRSNLFRMWNEHAATLLDGTLGLYPSRLQPRSKTFELQPAQRLKRRAATSGSCAVGHPARRTALRLDRLLGSVSIRRLSVQPRMKSRSSVPAQVSSRTGGASPEFRRDAETAPESPLA
jgi:hypothetical protein